VSADKILWSIGDSQERIWLMSNPFVTFARICRELIDTPIIQQFFHQRYIRLKMAKKIGAGISTYSKHLWLLKQRCKNGFRFFRCFVYK
jgi:hypothetical protein